MPRLNAPSETEDTPTALITRVADRGRDRHAREWMFKVYEHFIGFYFEFRTSTIEIVDTVAKGGDSVTYNMTSLVPLHGPNLRAFFEGKGTVAQYSAQHDCETGRSAALHLDLEI